MDDGDGRKRPGPPPGGFGALPPIDNAPGARRSRPGVGMPGYRRAREAGTGGPSLNWPRLAVVATVGLVVLLLVVVPLVSGGSGNAAAPRAGSSAALDSSAPSTAATAATCQPSAAPPPSAALPAAWQPLSVPQPGFGIGGAAHLYVDGTAAGGASTAAWVATGACGSTSAAALQPLAQTLFAMAVQQAQPTAPAGPSSSGVPSGGAPPATATGSAPSVSPPDTSGCDLCGTFPTDATPFHAAAFAMPAAANAAAAASDEGPCRPAADGRSVTCARADGSGATSVVVWLGSDPTVALFVAAKAAPAAYIPVVAGFERTLVGAMGGPVAAVDAVTATPTPAAAG